MKEDIRTMKSSDECISENSVNSRSYKNPKFMDGLHK